MRWGHWESIGWISANSDALVVWAFPSRLCDFLLMTFSSHRVSSRPGTTYWMAPIQSPLIKPVSLLGFRLRSSLDPMWSTNTSLDSWSKPFLSQTCINTEMYNEPVWLPFIWSVHICAYTVAICCFSAGCCFRDFLPCRAQGVMSAVTTVFWYVGSRARMTSYAEVC